MDLSYWKNLTPNLTISYTQKLFFNQYLYRLELTANGAQSIRSKYSVESSLQERIKSYRAINYAGSWVSRINSQLKKADPAWLNYIKNYKLNLPAGIKIRIEEPCLSLYSDNIEELCKFADEVPATFRKYLKEITVPRNDKEKDLLLAGKKIMRTKPKFRYKINFRDGKYSALTREQILNYLESLDKLVQIPKHCREELQKRFDSVWDAYIYSNDNSIVTFISLIEPRLIRSITEMTSAEDINTVIIQGGSNGQST